MVAFVTACAHPTLREDQLAGSVDQTPLAVDLRLPISLAAWRPHLEQDIREMAAAFPQVTARWQRSGLQTAEPSAEYNPPTLTLVVVEREREAAMLYQRLGLFGDPAVPRTFPAEGLAIVPLPRADRLVSGWPEPPQSWRHSFRHELAHLLSLQDATLRAAPLWFQEGFAEAWCDGRPDQALPPTWPFALHLHQWWSEPLAEAPAEVRYAAFGAQVRQLLRQPAILPWEQQEAFQGLPQPLASPFAGLRGREAAWDTASGRYLLATRSLEQVDLDLPWTWDGDEALSLELQLGRTGEPEAGLLFYPAEEDPRASSRVRLRFSRLGGLALYPEAAGEKAAFESVEEPAGEPQPGRRRAVTLLIREGNLVLEAEGFRRSVSLEGSSLTLPLQLRLYVRDGAFQVKVPSPQR